MIGGLAAPAQATVYSWRFPNSGSFDDPFNWSPSGGPPGSADFTLFDQDATYTVSFPSTDLVFNPPQKYFSDVLQVNRGNVSFVDVVGGQGPPRYTVNSLVIAPVSGVNAQLNTSLADFNVTGSVVIGENGGFGELNLSGGTLSVSGNITVHNGGNSNGSEMNITGGGILNQPTGSAFISFGSLGGGMVAVSGAGSAWHTGNLNVASVAGVSGELLIEQGGTVTSSSGRISQFTNTRGTVTVDGAGSTWTNAGLLGIGGFDATAQGTLNINLGGTVSTDSLAIVAGGTVNLDGGALNLNSLTANSGGAIHFNAGTVRFTAGAILDGDVLGAVLGSDHTIRPLRQLAVDGLAVLQSSIILDGGTFSVGVLANGSLLHLGHGTLSITDQAVNIETGGALGDTLDLAADTQVIVTLGLTNRGLVTGDGQIGGPIHNDVGGELRAEPGRSLTLTGAGNVNDGQINLFGGLLDITQDLTNNAAAFVSGNGTLRVAGGFTNDGVVNFSGATNVIGPVTNSATGKIVASGGGPTTFFDDMTNEGEVRTSAGAYTVFFGAVDGSGTFTGTGTVNFEGDLNPGNSPAALQFAGNVVLGPATDLSMELGGTALGSEYDHVAVAGILSLDGSLDVSLIDDFTPSAGQSFDVLDFGTLSGNFATINLPSVPDLTWDTANFTRKEFYASPPPQFRVTTTATASSMPPTILSGARMKAPTMFY